VDFLVEHGFAKLKERRVMAARDLLPTLQQREMNDIGETIAKQIGTPYQPRIAKQILAKRTNPNIPPKTSAR
jgi:hypothetical protein